MKNTMKKSLSVALGTTFLVAMSASPVANADTNPFGMQNLESGYMQVAEGKCGEGKCGEGKKKMESKMKKEGKCGESHMKEKEGKCGQDKMKDGAKMKEGKCGEGKMKDGAKMKEGKCGEGKMKK